MRGVMGNLTKGGFFRERTAVLFFCIMYGVGFAGHAVSATRPLMRVLTPWVLLLLGGAAIAGPLREGGLRFFFWMAATYLATFFLEALGVATGLVFGGYEYGTVLGSHLFGVPPVIGFNWAVVVLGFALLARRIFPVNPSAASPGSGGMLRVLLLSLVTAAFATAFDFLLEPVAIGLGYWAWDGVAVPLQNYIAWFVIAFLSALGFFGTGQKVQSPVPVGYVLIQAVFFAGLGFLV
jgi:putative membrane protein